MRAAVALGLASALMFPLSSRAASPSIADWLAGQRVNRCFPWFLSGISSTVEAFDPKNVNAAINTDTIDDGDALLAATVQRVGDDTLRVAYDAAHGEALFDHRSGESREEYVIAGVSAPPGGVTSADLSAVHTEKGVRLGMTLARTAATALRKAPHVVHACGYDAVVVQSSGQDCTNERDFIFKDRKLIAFGVGGNC